MTDISYIAGRVWTGGDLPSDLGDEAMLADLVAIQQAGITDILDNRIEWSDEEFVRTHVPHLGFLWNGADDAGQVMEQRSPAGREAPALRGRQVAPGQPAGLRSHHPGYARQRSRRRLTRGM